MTGEGHPATYTTVTLYDRRGSVLRRPAGRYEVRLFRVADGQDFGRGTSSYYDSLAEARRDAARLARDYGVPLADFTAR